MSPIFEVMCQESIHTEEMRMGPLKRPNALCWIVLIGYRSPVLPKECHCKWQRSNHQKPDRNQPWWEQLRNIDGQRHQRRLNDLNWSAPYLAKMSLFPLSKVMSWKLQLIAPFCFDSFSAVAEISIILLPFAVYMSQRPTVKDSMLA